MNRQSAKIALLACFVLTLAACGQQGGGGANAQADDSPEYQAFQFRDGVMHSLAWKVGKLRAMQQGDIPVDNAAALKNARDTAALAGMLADGFIPNSIELAALPATTDSTTPIATPIPSSTAASRRTMATMSPRLGSAQR